MSEEDINVESIDFEGHDLIGQEEYEDVGDISIQSASSIDPIYTKEEVEEWLSVSKPVEAITLHHTYSPNSSQYNGRSTILAIQNYHMNHGFSTIAANFYTTPTDDLIGFTARSLKIQNGAHAYISKPLSSLPSDLRARANGNRQFLNYRSIGIETISNMDIEDPTTNKSMRNSITLMAIICEYHNLNPNEDIFLHRFVEYKSCPGNLVSLDWIKSEVKKEMGIDTDCKSLPAKDYQEDALQWMKDEGLMVGDSTGNQWPQCNITRGDFAVILQRFYDKYICD